MKRIRLLCDCFTAPGLIVIGLLIGGTMLFAWFLWAIEQARADEMPIRAISVEQHDACANLPRGSQEMEERRYECFRKLYRGGWIRLNQPLMDRNRQDEERD